MSVRTMARVWEGSSHSGTELLMLLAIADFADDDGRAYPSISTLAVKCRTKPRYAVVLLNALEASGELEVRKQQGPMGRGGRTNLYRIVFDRLARVVPEVVNPGAPPADEVVNRGASLRADEVVHSGASLEAQAVNPGAVVNQSAVVHQGSGSSEPGFREVVNQGAPKPSLNHQEPPSLVRPRSNAKRTATRSKNEHPLFAEFYAAYPRKVARPAALKAFTALNPDRNTLLAMLAAIAAQGLADRCAAGEGRYVPHPASWLNGRRWEDQPAADSRRTGAALLDSDHVFKVSGPAADLQALFRRGAA